MKIASIVGARPQFVKLAPLARAVRFHQRFRSRFALDHIIIHTGQHYDDRMNRIFFQELGLPEPDYDLGVGSGSHGWQTGEIMIRAEKVLQRERPDWAIVYGDTNSTIGGALAAAKLGLPLAHIEAGMRSFDRQMPEETNRVLTDHCSDILFCPSRTAVRNLVQEGFKNIIGQGRLAERKGKHRARTIHGPFPWVVNVGDIMVDALFLSLAVARKKSAILKALQLTPRQYVLATIHRAQNTDERQRLKALTEALLDISRIQSVVFPVHPRTRKNLEHVYRRPLGSKRLKFIEPVGYFDMLILEKNAATILTDSGGVQKEAYLLRVPCLTLRDATEWTETVKSGWNILVGSDPDRVRERIGVAMSRHLERSPVRKREKKTWDYGCGDTASRILSVLRSTAG